MSSSSRDRHELEDFDNSDGGVSISNYDEDIESRELSLEVCSPGSRIGTKLNHLLRI